MKNTIIFATILALATSQLNYTSKSIVVLVGAKIKASQNTEETIKHKRKDCPVCKGKGWYISGDGIERIECQYCEPEEAEEWQTEILKQ